MEITKTISHLQFSSRPGIPTVTFISDGSRVERFGNGILNHRRAELGGMNLVPIKTAVSRLLSNPDGNVKIELDEEQHQQLVNFLDNGPIERFYAEDFGEPKSDQTVLAFSYGGKLPVNRAIAGRILDICKGMQGFTPSIIAQWEIADQIAPFKTGLNCHLYVKRIPISGYEIKDPSALVGSGLIYGVNGNSSEQQVKAALDGMLDDPMTDDKYWGHNFTDIHEIDDPLPMARFALGKATANFRTNYKNDQSSYPDHFKRLIKEFNMTSLMMLAPEGSIRFYITSKEVIDGFKKEAKLDKNGKDSKGEKPPVFVIGQSWHAPRILQLCNLNGLNVVGGSFLDMFSENDSQPWVRNPFSWLVKEAKGWVGDHTIFPA